MAARMDYSLGVESEYSDNSTLVSVDPLDDFGRSVLIGVGLEENSAKVTADLSSLIQYKNYRENSFPDELIFYLRANSDFTIRPSSFFWKIEDYFSRQRLNNLLPGTPDNLINTNVFSTGPDLYFRLTSSDSIYVGSRLNNYLFETDNSDNSRAIFRLAYITDISSATTMSLNTEYQAVEFVEIDDVDFDRQDFFISFETQPSRSEFKLDLGYTYVDRETLDDVDGYLARLLWQNQFRESSYFLLNAGSGYTDSGFDLLTSGAQNPEFERAGTQISADIYYEKKIEATYHFAINASSYDFQINYRDEDYEVLLQDRITSGGNFNYAYMYSPTTTLSAQFRYQKYNNLDIDQLDRQRIGSLAMNHRVSRNYTLRLEYVLNTQESNISSLNYDENKIFASFFYGRDPGSYR